MEHTTFAKILEVIDQRHAGDPAGRELGYAEQMTRWLELLVEAPPDTLRIAVRAQHFERWRYPRKGFPPGRDGYLRWRLDAANRQAQAIGELLASLDVDTSNIERVQALMLKKRLKRDEHAQALEDCACLVFLETELERFADGREADQLLNILKRTWAKMSDAGRQRALALPLDAEHRSLLERVA